MLNELRSSRLGTVAGSGRGCARSSVQAAFWQIWMAILLAGVCTGTSSCADDRPIIFLQITGLQPEVASLSFNISLNDKPMIGVAPTIRDGLDSVHLRLPVGSQGQVAIRVGAQRADGCSIAGALVSLELTSLPEYQATATLSYDEQFRGCSVRISAVGDGNATIAISPPPQTGAACELSESNRSCRVYLPNNTRLTLTAEPRLDKTSKSAFVGWTGDCSGRGSCQLQIDDRTHEVGVGIIPQAACSNAGLCWEHPLPRGFQTHAVWGTSTNSVWFVGDAGTVIYWNGTFFTTYSVRSSDPQNPQLIEPALFSIWGSSPNDIWAAGDSTVHFDGLSWRATDGPSGVMHLWGTGAKDVWAVTTDGKVVHYDGSWQVMKEFPTNLYSIWGSSPTDVWVGGNGFLVHYDGHDWTKIADPLLQIKQPSIWGIWGSGPNDVFFVGTRQTSVAGLVAEPASLHFDGATWRDDSPVPTDYLYEGLFAIWGSGSNDVWAAGTTSIHHFDGSAWRRHAYTGSLGIIYGVWGSSSDDVWASGEAVARLVSNYFVRQDSVLTSVDLNGIWGSGTDDVWVAGNQGALLHRSDGVWTTSRVSTTADLFSISGTGPEDVWIVGTGTVLHMDPTRSYFNDLWVHVPDAEALISRMTQLRAVYAASSGEVFIGGEDGTILYYDGATWSSSQPTSGDIYALWGTGPSDVYAAGYETILHYDGTSWQEVAHIPGVLMRGIAGTQSFEVLAGGEGELWKDEGFGWQRVDTDISPLLLYGAAGSDTDVFLFGYRGTLIQYTFAELKFLGSGAFGNLNAGWVSSTGDLFAVGRLGAILHRSPQ